MRVLAALADEVGIDLTLRDAAGTRAEIMRLGAWEGSTPEAPDVAPQTPAQPLAGTAVLTGWRMLLGTGAAHGRLQDGEPHLAGTARPAVARLSPASAEAIGAVDGDAVVVAGAVTLPLEITAMPDGVMWAPLGLIAAQPGSVVDIARAGDAP
jgi:NADH-quinone oxidoreductase subunit G